MDTEYLIEISNHCDDMTEALEQDIDNRTLLVLAADKTLLFPNPEDYESYMRRLESVGCHYLLHYYGDGNDIVGSVAMAMIQDKDFADIICEAHKRYCDYLQHELATSTNPN